MDFEARPKGIPIRTRDGMLYQDWFLIYSRETDTAGNQVGQKYYGGIVRLPYGALGELRAAQRGEKSAGQAGEMVV